MRRDLLNNGRCSILANSKILNRIKQSNTILIQSTFHTAIKSIQDMSIGLRRNILSNDATGFQPLNLFRVDIADIELEHFCEYILRNIVH